MFRLKSSKIASRVSAACLIAFALSGLAPNPTSADAQMPKSGVSLVTERQKCRSGFYPLVCRNPAASSYDVDLRKRTANQRSFGSYTFGFGFISKAARSTGGPLQPNTCAWVDRPLSESEPRTATIRFGSNNAWALDRTEFQIQRIERCRLSSQCRFRICAKTISGGDGQPNTFLLDASTLILWGTPGVPR